MTQPERIGRRAFLQAATAQAAVGFALGEVPASPRARADEGARVQLGIGASLGGRRVFPPDNPWNEDVSQKPVDPNSAVLVEAIGRDAPLVPDFGRAERDSDVGIPYVVVPGRQRRVPVTFEYADESDKGPYPIPPDAPVEGGRNSRGDRHVLAIDRDNWKLYELFAAYPEGDGWKAGSGAVWNLNSNRLRTKGWTSADAAGLPVFPGLVRADEVFEQGAIRHALRFTCRRTRRAYVFPARHFASRATAANLPPMGMRVRLKAQVEASRFSPEARVIVRALQTYGMFLADNGQNWFLSGVPDPRWTNSKLAELKRIRGRDFEVVQMGALVTR